MVIASKDFVAALNKFSSEQLWMIEFSVPELFSANLRKLGEVLVRAERKVGSKRKSQVFFSHVCLVISRCTKAATLTILISNSLSQVRRVTSCLSVRKSVSVFVSYTHLNIG